MRDTERQEREAEGEAGSSQGARCGTRSQILGSLPELKADAQLLSHSGIPRVLFITHFVLASYEQLLFLKKLICFLS